MSVLQVDSFAPRLGGTTFGHVGIAKATCLFNQVTPAVTDSDNVSSLTDTSAGVSVVNLTNAFSDANHRTVCNAASNGEDSFMINSASAGGPGTSRTSSSLGFRFYDTTTPLDPQDANTTFHGDLA